MWRCFVRDQARVPSVAGAGSSLFRKTEQFFFLMSSSRSMDGREAAITVAPGRAAPGCGSVLAGGGGARGSEQCWAPRRLVITGIFSLRCAGRNR